MLTIIAYHPEGFEIRFQQEDPAKVEQSVAWLVKQGYRPTRGFQYTPEGLPICPRHGIPMQKREKQGDTWYSHNMGTEDNPNWCRGYHHKSSPGWEAGRDVAPEIRQRSPSDHSLMSAESDEPAEEYTLEDINDMLFGES